MSYLFLVQRVTPYLFQLTTPRLYYMKNLTLILFALSFVAGVFGFFILAGTTATILRVLFVIFLLVSMLVSIIARVRTKKVLKPVPGTFATSFQSEIK